MVSAAQYIEDVETDPAVLVDGLTKSFRYPGCGGRLARAGYTTRVPLCDPPLAFG